MQYWRSLIVRIFIILVCLHLTACEETPTSHEAEEPVKIENIAGTSLHRLKLTAEAAKRIDIHVALVSNKQVPYSAIIYDSNGEAWVYTNPEPLTYIRAPILIDSIKDDIVYLTDGPATGTTIVSVGPSELFGAEFQGSLEP